jgi:hypothetical protein
VFVALNELKISFVRLKIHSLDFLTITVVPEIRVGKQCIACLFFLKKHDKGLTTCCPSL